MPSSAVTKESPLWSRFVTELMLMLPTEGLPLVPGEQNVTGDHDKPVAQKSQQSDAQHRRHHDVVAIKQIRIIQQITKPAPDREHLRNHHEHPSDTHRQPDTGKN